MPWAISALVLFLCAFLCAPAIARCGASPQQRRQLSVHQQQLLDIAFAAASTMPLDPHIKNRSRLQAEVVAACFELDQPQLALDHAEQIADWRRGLCFADYAYYCQGHGKPEVVERYLALAEKAAASVLAEPDEQAWRAERIRVTIARTLALRGEAQKAAGIVAAVSASESEPLQIDAVSQLKEADVAKYVASTDRIFEVGQFDQVVPALKCCAHLHRRFYGDAALREPLESRVLEGYDKLPLKVRVDLILQIAGNASDHGDQAHARDLLLQTRHAVAGGRWLPEDEVPLLASIAAAMHRAEDATGARAHLQAAADLFEQRRALIVDIYRGGCLRSIAAAFVTLGDNDKAADAYARAVAAGVENPNSRPRAEDLARTCLSMARSGFEPDASLARRLNEVRSALGDPW